MSHFHRLLITSNAEKEEAEKEVESWLSHAMAEISFQCVQFCLKGDRFCFKEAVDHCD